MAFHTHDTSGSGVPPVQEPPHGDVHGRSSGMRVAPPVIPTSRVHRPVYSSGLDHRANQIQANAINVDRVVGIPDRHSGRHSWPGAVCDQQEAPGSNAPDFVRPSELRAAVLRQVYGADSRALHLAVEMRPGPNSYAITQPAPRHPTRGNVIMVDDADPVSSSDLGSSPVAAIPEGMVRRPADSEADRSCPVHGCKRRRIWGPLQAANAARLFPEYTRSMVGCRCPDIDQLPRTQGSFASAPAVGTAVAGSASSAEDRQRDDSSLRERLRGQASSSGFVGSQHPVAVQSTQHPPVSGTHRRFEQHPGRPSVAADELAEQARVEHSAPSVSPPRQPLGPAYAGSLRVSPEHATAAIQLADVRRPVYSDRRLHAGLGDRDQLARTPDPADRQDAPASPSVPGIGHDHRATLATADMVASSAGDRDSSTDLAEPARRLASEPTGPDRAESLSLLAFDSLESLWEHHAIQAGWSPDDAKLLGARYRSGTLDTYNAMFHRLCAFLQRIDHPGTLPLPSAILASFFNDLTQNLQRPGSMLKQAFTVATHVHRFTGYDPSKDQQLVQLIKGIRNSKTSRPARRSEPVPADRIVQYFISLGPNEGLSRAQLRMKAMALLALVFCWRPSDAALLRMSHVSFDGNLLVITHHGGKTDSNRDGLRNRCPPASDPLACPVRALRAYIDATSDLRESPDSFLFIHDREPFDRGLTSQRCSNILTDAAVAAGLDGSIYTGRTFRSGGASAAINAGLSPDMVKQQGRWTSTDVFWNHYVHTCVPASFADNVLGVAPQPTRSDAADDDSRASSDR